MIAERVVAGLSTWCLRLAARRWPPAIRADQHAEWVAELHALRAEPGGRATRGWRQLRFAASLAASPAVEDPDGRRARVDVGRPRDRRRPGGSRLVGPALALLAAPLLAFTVGASICAFVAVLFVELLRDGDKPPSRFTFVIDRHAHSQIDWPAHAASIVAVVLCAVALAGLGHWLGGRLPLRAAHRGRLTLTGSAVVAPLVVAAGGTLLLSLGLASGALRFRTITGYDGPSYLAGAAVWTAVTAAAGWWVARHRVAWPWTMLAAVLVSYLAVTVAGLRSAHAVGLGAGTAPRWFPMSLLSPDGWNPPDAAVSPLAAVSSQLFDGSLLALTCSCLVLAYGARAARPAPHPGSAEVPAA